MRRLGARKAAADRRVRWEPAADLNRQGAEDFGADFAQ